MTFPSRQHLADDGNSGLVFRAIAVRILIVWGLVGTFGCFILHDRVEHEYRVIAKLQSDNHRMREQREMDWAQIGILESRSHKQQLLLDAYASNAKMAHVQNERIAYLSRVCQ